MLILKTVGVVAIVAFLSCSQGSDTNWMKGGTLQQATVAEWNQATPENKLASCADLATAIKKGYGKKYESVYEWRLDAEIMRSLIDDSLRKNTVATAKVAEVAAVCNKIGK
ncbi:MAG: hypothetical protein EOP52_10455 [Sphingobacteriales bacterium]|nr:MAG: hypothetical protein EOP52_10455 [Sphingobacteriales bacterium]